MRSTAGSSNSPSRDDWLGTNRAILPSAQSENPLNISTATAHAFAWIPNSRYRKTGTSSRRSTDNALGTVSTRSRTSPGVRSMRVNLAENPRQTQGRHGVVRQRVVVHHVRPRRCRPGEFGQVDAGLLLDRGSGLERLLRGLDGVGGQRRERIDGHPVELVQRILPAECAQMDALADVGEIGQVIGPAAVKVIQHDQPADLLQLLLTEFVEHFLVALRLQL